jgi:hypothetical protein
MTTEEKLRLIVEDVLIPLLGDLHMLDGLPNMSRDILVMRLQQIMEIEHD